MFFRILIVVQLVLLLILGVRSEVRSEVRSHHKQRRNSIRPASYYIEPEMLRYPLGIERIHAGMRRSKVPWYLQQFGVVSQRR
ncbi:hypothetical protein M3Y96_00369100 [Aphelenchoides besseyi]|nr:hypothetical protein M3Y96_00369100 [Aphelenchoides besseyi]